MSKWIRTTLALVVGVVAGGISIAGIEMLGHSIVEGQSIFVFAAAGLGLSAFVGGSVAAWIGKVSHLAFVVAIVLAGLSLVNVFSFKHPAWYVPIAFALLGVGAGAAYQFHKSRSVAP
jgi:hypothetical protein